MERRRSGTRARCARSRRLRSGGTAGRLVSNAGGLLSAVGCAVEITNSKKPNDSRPEKSYPHPPKHTYISRALFGERAPSRVAFDEEQGRRADNARRMMER